MPATTSNKNSFSVPSTPANSRNHAAFSAATNSAKSERCAAPPVTPQRLSQAQKSKFGSPFTPVSSFSTPYTPLSFRSVASSNNSTLNTPGSAQGAKRLNFPVSPGLDARIKDQSIADLAPNWRYRANENGIRVSLAPGDPDYADDEDSDHTLSDPDSPEFITAEEALLPPPFLSTHRRARAYSHAVAPRTPVSPQLLRTPVRKTLSNLNTPPRRSSYAQQLKAKGSFTDPPQTRRRPPFGQVSVTHLSNIDENEYTPYAQSLCSPARPLALPLSLNDPFHSPGLSTITESEQQQFSIPNLPYQSHIHFHSTQPQIVPEIIDTSSCSVCGRTSCSLAVLDPCSHPLCSACLTSALNIVGEKDMECAVCKGAVKAFRLTGPTTHTTRSAETFSRAEIVNHNVNMRGESFMDPLLSPASSPNRISSNREPRLLPSVLEMADTDAFSDQGYFFEGARDASTPVLGRVPTPTITDNVVLRVDNVPWDITPPGIIAWVKQPVERVHVLLDRKGKTLSHAFVEVANEDAAKAALRGAQNSVLGKGKRARGVTVTRSGQEELMRALFPSWKGRFDGSKPSLAGLDNDRVISTLETGLITEDELTSLLHLIRSPDSHFLKVPSLPFHSLISILSKFPADIDSRVFWSGSLRNTMYDITFTAVQILISKVTEKDGPDNLDLLSNLISAAINCQAFTSHQIKNLCELVDSPSIKPSVISPPAAPRTPEGDADGHARVHVPEANHPAQPQFVDADADPERALNNSQTSFGALAKEFGVEAQLVEALAQRLASIC